jgi:hypothetical protein
MENPLFFLGIRIMCKPTPAVMLRTKSSEMLSVLWYDFSNNISIFFIFVYYSMQKYDFLLTATGILETKQ